MICLNMQWGSEQASQRAVAVTHTLHFVHMTPVDGNDVLAAPYRAAILPLPRQCSLVHDTKITESKQHAFDRCARCFKERDKWNPVAVVSWLLYMERVVTDHVKRTPRLEQHCPAPPTTLEPQDQSKHVSGSCDLLEKLSRLGSRVMTFWPHHIERPYVQ